MYNKPMPRMFGLPKKIIKKVKLKRKQKCHSGR
jgi:hypothetical protein